MMVEDKAIAWAILLLAAIHILVKLYVYFWP